MNSKGRRRQKLSQPSVSKYFKKNHDEPPVKASKTEESKELDIRPPSRKRSSAKEKLWDFQHGKTPPETVDDDSMETEEPTEGRSSNRSANRISSRMPLKKNELSSPENEKTVNSKTKTKYTPLEEQVVKLKNENPDVVLLIECGYKYRFFDKDAEIAARELNITCHPDHNFMTASIPTFRLQVHVKKLVAKGYKVGVVKQTETAAVKASGDNKSSVFTRKLTSIYTKSTLIGEELSSSYVNKDDEVFDDTTAVSGFLMSIFETDTAVPNQVTIGMVAVQPTTGDVQYSSFEDNKNRTMLEKSLICIQPVEALLPAGLLSSLTKMVIQNVASLSPTSDDRMRIEYVPDSEFDFTRALQGVTDFYSASCHSLENQDSIQKLLQLPPVVICALAAVISYLKQFHLESVFKDPGQILPMTLNTQGVNLPATTLKNLEVFVNLADHQECGSLLSFLNHTLTQFGKRQLSSWLSQPLADVNKIVERQEAVTEILQSEDSLLTDIKKLLIKCSDLEKKLCAALHKKLKPLDFFLMCTCMTSIYKGLSAYRFQITSQIKSESLRTLLLEVLDLLHDIESYLKNLDGLAIRNKDKKNVFVDVSPYPSLQEKHDLIFEIKKKLDSLNPIICRQLELPSFKYTTVSGLPYLIEVKNTKLSHVPKSWLKISGTKQVSRFRSPEVSDLYHKLCVEEELLLQEVQKAWLQFLEAFSSNFYRYKKAVNLLGTLDCYYSLAAFAKFEGYVRPNILPKNERVLCIKNGRHPMSERLLGSEAQYVANSTGLDSSHRAMIITGPNMGGKSSYIRQVALIVILAQIGSYVPAESATISVVDGIYVRMGASDDIIRKRSTFLVEMEEASEILKNATEYSLVIMDELGRGTSTHDGMAIAFSTLRHLIEKARSFTLFVTHYLPLTELQALYPGNVSNHHMAFFIFDDGDSSEVSAENLTFLYTLTEGRSERSYGMNVARLADIPDSIITVAERKSRELETTVERKRFLYKSLKLALAEDLTALKDFLK